MGSADVARGGLAVGSRGGAERETDVRENSIASHHAPSHDVLAVERERERERGRGKGEVSGDTPQFIFYLHHQGLLI